MFNNNRSARAGRLAPLRPETVQALNSFTVLPCDDTMRALLRALLTESRESLSETGFILLERYRAGTPIGRNAVIETTIVQRVLRFRAYVEREAIVDERRDDRAKPQCTCRKGAHWAADDCPRHGGSVAA